MGQEAHVLGLLSAGRHVARFDVALHGDGDGRLDQIGHPFPLAVVDDQVFLSSDLDHGFAQQDEFGHQLPDVETQTNAGQSVFPRYIRPSCFAARLDGGVATNCLGQGTEVLADCILEVGGSYRIGIGQQLLPDTLEPAMFDVGQAPLDGCGQLRPLLALELGIRSG